MSARGMVIAVIVTALFVGCASNKVKPTFDQSNQFIIERTIDELNVGEVLKHKIPVTATVALVSMEVNQTLDHPIVATLEDQLLNSLIGNGFDVLERDPDILERLLQEKHEDTYSLIITKDNYDFSFETTNVQPDFGPEFQATQLMGADYLISYRVLELGLTYQEAEDRKYTKRESFVRLHVRVQNCETGNLSFAENLEATITDSVQTKFIQQLENFHYSFFQHKFPGQPNDATRPGPVMKISEINEGDSGALVGTPSFYAGFGVMRFMLNDRDPVEHYGIDPAFFGLNPTIGYRINQKVGLNLGYKSTLTAEGDNGANWWQSAFHVSLNVFPFTAGAAQSYYIIAGVDMVNYEFTRNYYEDYFGYSYNETEKRDETGVVVGFGYELLMGSRFSFNPEISVVSGDAGGINFGFGGRIYF